MRTLALVGMLGSLVVPVSSARAAACPHPYFPMEQGLQLTYRAGSAQFSLLFGEVEKTEGGLKANIELLYREQRGTTEAVCSAEGVTTGLGGIEGTALQTAGLDVKVLSSEGVAFPPPKEMTSGKTWTNVLALELRPPKTVQLPTGFSPKIRTQFARESTVVGSEKVTVASQTFDALKIRNTTTAGKGVGNERTVVSHMWVAPKVGILKIMTGESVDLELLKVDLPKRTAASKPTRARQAP